MPSQVIIPQKSSDLDEIAQALNIAANAYGIYSNRERLKMEENKFEKEQKKYEKEEAEKDVATPGNVAALYKLGMVPGKESDQGAIGLKLPEDPSKKIYFVTPKAAQKYTYKESGNRIVAINDANPKDVLDVAAAPAKPGKGEEGMKPAQKAVDQNFAKWYAEEVATGNIANLGSNIRKLKDAREIIASGDITGDTTGKILGVLPDAATDVFSSKRADVRDTVYGVAQESLKTILGSQFTAKEGEGVLKRSFNMRLSPEANVERLDKLISKLEAAAQQKIDAAKYYEQNGTLDGFKGKIINKLDDVLSGETYIAEKKKPQSQNSIKKALDSVESKATATPSFNPDRYLSK